MTPEERSLLERTHKLTEENNEILRKMRRNSRISGVFRIFYWTVIIIVSFGAYYLIQPYLETLVGVYGQIQGNIDSVQGASSSLQDLWK